MIADLLTYVGYVVGGFFFVGMLITVGMVVVFLLAALVEFGAWVIDGIRD